MRKVHAALLLTLLLAASDAALGQRAVVVVRHAEKISDDDQRLSPAGFARADRLAALLKDAGVSAVYATDTERARDTAGPLAKALGLPIRTYDVGGEKPDAAAFVASLRERHATGVVLLVGHSDTVPVILKALGCTEAISIGRDEYDDLFIVTPTGGRATLVRLKY